MRRGALMTELPRLFAVTDPRCYPDLRCESSVAQQGRDGQWVGHDCVLEDEHDDDHTDGDLYWNDDNDVTFR
jgi:hypothetical protein